MSPILHIIGPTATGKTALALAIAKAINGELISADSRQVYRGMDIGSGKDIPPGAVWQTSDYRFGGQSVGYYQTEGTKIWGYDLVDPNADWSIAHFHSFSGGLIRHMDSRSVLPIIVGGAGLYHRVIWSPPQTLSIPQNPQLRHQYQSATAKDLQTVMAKAFPVKLADMNQSDRSNPRRLIRALEIGYYQKRHKEKPVSELKSDKPQSLWIGLDLPNEVLERQIKARVLNRLSTGFEVEFAKLKDLNVLISGSPAGTATGYRQWQSYIGGTISRDEAMAKWVTAEIQYAKRQKTWFKTNPDISWYAADTPNLRQLVVQKIKNWYSIVNG